MDAFQQHGGNEGWDPEEISARGPLPPKIEAILQPGSPCGSDPPARGNTNVKAETGGLVLVAARTAGSQESNAQDVPAQVKQSLSRRDKRACDKGTCLAGCGVASTVFREGQLICHQRDQVHGRPEVAREPQEFVSWRSDELPSGLVLSSPSTALLVQLRLPSWESLCRGFTWNGQGSQTAA